MILYTDMYQVCQKSSRQRKRVLPQQTFVQEVGSVERMLRGPAHGGIMVNVTKARNSQQVSDQQ